jgi:hypothetical protein
LMRHLRPLCPHRPLPFRPALARGFLCASLGLSGDHPGFASPGFAIDECRALAPGLRRGFARCSFQPASVRRQSGPLSTKARERKRRRTVSGISQSNPSASFRIAAFSWEESASHTFISVSHPSR